MSVNIRRRPKQVKAAPVSATMALPAFHHADFGSF